jgi:[acyl-carrier-protein] S-malonyltransferase
LLLQRRARIIEMGKIAYIFPGQGAQSVGMGRDLYDSYPSARSIFEKADEVLGLALTELCFEGPEEELTMTINAQPALVTVAFACLSAIMADAGTAISHPSFVAGHSLGEYTALAAAKVLDFPATVKLARERGRLMHEAGQKQPGAMLAVLGMEEAVLAEICKEAGVWLANINCPGQLVISGAKDNIARAKELAEARGARRAVPLAVSGAFHTPLMQPAVDGMSQAISSLEFHNPAIPVVANTSAKPMIEAEQVKKELLTQLCNSIQWQRSVEYMVNEGVSTFIEIGPGNVLTGLIKRINRDVTAINIGDVQSVKKFVSTGGG